VIDHRVACAQSQNRPSPAHRRPPATASLLEPLVLLRVEMPVSEKVYTLKDVSSHDLVLAFAQHLKKEGKMQVPKWVDLAKTGPFKELAPYDEDFYFIRAGEPHTTAPPTRALLPRGGTVTPPCCRGECEECGGAWNIQRPG
jgi:hypothetical protein